MCRTTSNRCPDGTRALSMIVRSFAAISSRISPELLSAKVPSALRRSGARNRPGSAS
jgi:hypothetical protein